MARVNTAYLRREDVPKLGALQAAIAPLGFKLTLDDGYAPFETKGYLPCTLDGEDAGFDLRFQSVEDGLSPEVTSALGERDTALVIRWGGDPREELAAFAVLAALAKNFGAVVREPEPDRLLTFDDLIARAKKASEAL